MNDVEKRIITVLEKLKPYLANDGGGVEFVKFEDGIAYVRFMGACKGCYMIDQTLKDGIEMALTEEIPEVIEVRKIED
jgi:Fe-S cluster biogenesis protein NfuA